MEIALIIVGSILGVLILIWLMLPSKVLVERTITINAPVDKAFNQVNNLKNWNNWSPWNSIDPNMQIEYSDPSEGQGAWYTWKSDHKRVGNGKLTLAEVVPNQKTVTAMEFEKWGDNTATMNFSESNGTSKITWSMENEMKGIAKFFGPMMKGMLSKQFDEGLAAIKAEAEK